MKKTVKSLTSICQWCGQPNHIICVHGHGQCSGCGYNIDECCNGETCEKPDEKNLTKEETE